MSEQSAVSVRADLFSGAGLGLLVGILVGLSVSEVVAAILASLAALLAAALGLVSASEKIGVRPWRIGAFGIFGALAVLAGVYVRAHNLLAPSPADQFHTWTRIGLPAPRAAELVAYRELGIVPASAQVEAREPRGERSVLYAVAAEVCRDLDPAQFPELGERLNAWRLQGGPWEELAVLAGGLPAAEAGFVLAASWRLACERSG